MWKYNYKQRLKIFCITFGFWFILGLAHPSISNSQPISPGQKLTIANLTLTSADTEYSYTFPSGTLYFTVKARTSAVFKIAFSENASGTTYETVPAGSQWIPDRPLLLRDNRIVYVQSSTAGLVLEISYIQ